MRIPRAVDWRAHVRAILTILERASNSDSFMLIEEHEEPITAHGGTFFYWFSVESDGRRVQLLPEASGSAWIDFTQSSRRLTGEVMIDRDHEAVARWIEELVQGHIVRTRSRVGHEIFRTAGPKPWLTLDVSSRVEHPGA